MNNILDIKSKYDNRTGDVFNQWIQYDDGVFEPVREKGNLNLKKQDSRNPFWWVVDKPNDWRPEDGGAQWETNHKPEKEDARVKPDGQGIINDLVYRPGEDHGRAVLLPYRPKPGEKPKMELYAQAEESSTEGPQGNTSKTRSGEQPSARNSMTTLLLGDPGGSEEKEGSQVTPGRSSNQDSSEIRRWEQETGNSVRDVDERMTPKPGERPTWFVRELGSKEYYNKRAEDYETRNPGKRAPEYYREYGDKYVKRFDALKRNLSPEGRKWVDKTKLKLQQKMEAGLQSGQWGERDEKGFRDKAFDSHSDAYLEADLDALPVEDKERIMGVVDPEDVDMAAMKEAWEVAWDSGWFSNLRLLDDALIMVRHGIRNNMKKRK